VISPPIWKKLWFIVLLSAIIIYIIYLIIKIRERNHRKMQEYLKKTLDERTKEVVEQKEEIELQRDQLEQTNKVLESKNKDITDSINYAQRIQAAILPSKTTLQKYFKSSFIFYRPRDIVSGDFYWFEKYHDKFIILCADATGHGVPGAFMSLISITLIKDIIKTSDPDHPGMILTKLDNEIKNTLNQEIDADIKTHDGLDVSVCIIDLNTNFLTYASALRPLFVFASGEMKYIKGSRFPVGGVKTTQKNFEEVKIQLSQGDSIYMFTDGYPDQFGGGDMYEGGKKMKMIRFKNIISKIIHEDINRQYETIENEFDSWKGKYPQIDDVLVIGIKI
jgi:serine phosphatase RsbU (regulator of sigma subunit)